MPSPTQSARVDRLSWLVLIAAVGLFVYGVWSKRAVPLLEWDHEYLDAAAEWSRGVNKPWIFDHPPLYPALLALLFRVTDVSVSTGRLFNAAVLAMTAGVLGWWTARLASHTAAVWAVALYLLCPLTIQGALSFDGADTHLLALGITSVFAAVTWAMRDGRLRSDTALIAAAMMVCCWMKVTSTLAVLAGLMLYAWLGARDVPNAWHRKLWWGIVLGGAAYLLTWSLVALTWWGPEAWVNAFTRPLRSLHENVAGVGGLVSSQTPSARAARIGLDGVRLLFWGTPALWVMAGWQSWRLRSPRAEHAAWRLVAGVTAWYVLGYLAVHGGQWAFPRYHGAILPAVAALGGLWVAERWPQLTPRDQRIVVAGAVICGIVLARWVGDPLLWLSTGWKQAALDGALRPALIRGAIQGALFIAVPLGVAVCLRRHAAVWLSATLAAALGFYGHQTQAAHATGYQYGAYGKSAVVKVVADQLRPGDAVLALPEFTYAWRAQGVPFLSHDVWFSTANIQQSLQELRPRAVVTGLTTQTLAQCRAMRDDPAITTILRREFAPPQTIGTYWVWLRRE